MNKELQNLLNEQLTSWEMAQKNYDALKRVRVKEVEVNGCLYKVQFNPARIVSSAAKVDSKSIQERKCFLCPPSSANAKGDSFRKPLSDIGQSVSHIPQAPDSSRTTARRPAHLVPFC